MNNRAVIYFRKNKARKILESPLKADLKTLLSATLAVSRNSVVKRHIQNTLEHLHLTTYKLSA